MTAPWCAGLEELRQAGARIAYEVVDTASPTDMLLAVQRIESRLGPVTAVAHAVAPGPSTPFADLSQQDLGARARRGARGTCTTCCGRCGPTGCGWC